MSITPVLPKLGDLLPGSRGAEGGLATPLGELELPDLTGPQRPGLPPGIVNRVVERGFDALPPGLARQLSGPAPPSPPGAPTPPAPGPSGAPNAGLPTSPGAATPSTSSPSTSSTPTLPTAPSTPTPPALPFNDGPGAGRAGPGAPVGLVNQLVENATQGVRAQAPAGPIATNASPDSALPPGLSNRAAQAAAPQAVPPTPQAAQSAPTANANQAPAISSDPAAQKLPPVDLARQAPATRASAAPEAPFAARGEQLPADRFAALRRPIDVAVAMTTALSTAASNAVQSFATPARAEPASQIPLDSRIGALPTDRAQGARVEAPLAPPIYIGDGPWRRRSRRLAGLLPAHLTRWLQQAGMARHHGASYLSDPENELGFHLRWMYWTLAIVAYGCLALALTAMVQSHVDVAVVRRPLPVAPLLGIGAAAALGAWWVARRLTRR